MASLYRFLIHLALPLAVLRLLWRSRRAPEYRQRILERLGCFTSPKQACDLWIHAVSVGEVNAALPLIEHLLAQNPKRQICVTTTTPTGSARLRNRLAERVFHVYFPFDVPFAMGRFLHRVQPEKLILLETEIWPNLLSSCHKRNIEVILINGRLSERSARGYAKVAGFTRKIFAKIDWLGAQTKADAKRFVALGMRKERVKVIGNLKFDLLLPASLAERAEVERRSLGNRRAWIAASTHPGEDEKVLTAHLALLQVFPDALLILVPRHPERFQTVADLVEKEKLTLARRSAHQLPTPETQVYLGDTMGDLAVLLGTVDFAFIGGSLVAVGGHNMLEAAAQGVPCAFGPNIFNFNEIGKKLKSSGAAIEVENEDQLARLAIQLFEDPKCRAEMGQAGLKVIENNRGSLDRLLNWLDLAN